MALKNIRRGSKQLQQHARFLIIVEGRVTERQYLDGVKRARKMRSAEIEIVPPGPTSPMEIVLKAVQLRSQASRFDAYDEVWCVFDAEAKIDQQARPNLLRAMTLASRENIFVALSNPCFELWLILHEEDQFAWLSSDRAQARCKELMIVDRKHLASVGTLLEKYAAAKARAIALEEKHDRDLTENLVHRNPASTVYRLVDSVHKAFPN